MGLTWDRFREIRIGPRGGYLLAIVSKGIKCCFMPQIYVDTDTAADLDTARDTGR